LKLTVAALIFSAQMFPAAMRSANWLEMRPLYITLFIMTPLGGVLLLYLDPSIVRRVMGIIIISASIISMSGWQYSGKRGIGAASVFGSVAGFGSGFVGIGGPAFVMFVMAHPGKPNVQCANILIGAGLQILLVSLTLVVSGKLGFDTLTKGVIIAPAHLFGGMCGAYLFKLAPQRYFKQVTLATIILLGIIVVTF
jgi:uncharacterized membrane protein YfcA